MVNKTEFSIQLKDILMLKQDTKIVINMNFLNKALNKF